ncbi:MAG: thiol protease/hemagglutinin PrtT [Bacteroidales bacterium]|nr:thiol protease/hemagglutinin PrtT [Bacteroidales bacterium]
MRRSMTLFLLLFFCTLNGWTRQRTTEEIKAIIGTQFASTNSSSKSIASDDAAFDLAATASTFGASARSVAEEAFYIYNREGGGFIIVSGDDRITPVLGYSEKGSFPTNSIPEGLQGWMNTYSEKISALLAHGGAVQSSQPINQNGAVFPVSVAPFIQTTWNQNEPFNNYCPIYQSGTGEIQSLVGCVGTAMAQVMKYYNYPTKGTGSNSYTSHTRSLNVSANFGETTYDWSNMLDSYASGSYSEDNWKAIATLMYHCGVSVNMDYCNDDQGSSSAVAHEIVNSLVKYFGYDTHMSTLSRDYFSTGEWMTLIKSELTALRPVIYSGFSTYNGGHAFIVDGYDKNDLLHVNWGYGGHFDGYYNLSILNPKDGTNSGYNYSENYYYNQSMQIGIQKPTAGSIYHPLLTLENELTPSATSVGRNDLIDIDKVVLMNNGASFKGKVYKALYQNGTFITLLDPYMDLDLRNGEGMQVDYPGFRIPGSVTPGTYQLYIVGKDEHQNDWSKLRSKVNVANYLTVTVTESAVTLTKPTTDFSLSLSEITVDRKIYSGHTGQITYSLVNGAVEFDYLLGAILVSNVDQQGKGVLFIHDFVAANQQKECTLSTRVNVDPGEYTIYPVYSINNGADWIELPCTAETKTTTVYDTPVGESALSLTDTPGLEKTVLYQGEKASLSVNIKNEGVLYEDYVYVVIFKDLSSPSIDFLSFPVYLDNKENKSFTFTFNPPAESRAYKLTLYHSVNGEITPLTDGNGQEFIDFQVAEGTGVEKNSLDDVMLIYPSGTSDRVTIKGASELSRLDVLSLAGTTLLSVGAEELKVKEYTLSTATLSSGLYLLRVTTSEGTQTIKFTKK